MYLNEIRREESGKVREYLEYHLNQFDVLDWSGMESVDFDFKRGASTPTGIKAILKGFYDVDGGYYGPEDVAKSIITNLINDGELEDVKWYYKYTSTHSWGRENYAGNYPSVFDVQLLIYRNQLVD